MEIILSHTRTLTECQVLSVTNVIRQCLSRERQIKQRLKDSVVSTEFLSVMRTQGEKSERRV